VRVGRPRLAQVTSIQRFSRSSCAASLRANPASAISTPGMRGPRVVSDDQ